MIFKIDSKTLRVIIILVVFILLISLAIFNIFKKTKADYYVLKPIDLNYSILSNCVVEYPDPLDITVSGENEVVEIYVKDGAKVTKGQKLIKFDDFNESRNLTISYNNYITSQLKLRNSIYSELPKLKEKLNIDLINLEQSQKTLERAKTSFNSGALSANEFENAENNYKKALAQYNQTKIQLDSFQSSGEAALFEEQVSINKAQYELAQKRVEEKTVVAPFDGTVLKINVQNGQKTKAGSIVATVIEKKNWILVLNIDQKELPFLDMGQKALVSLDAYPENKIEADIVYLCSRIDATKGTCETRLEIKEDVDFIKHGMSGSSEIFVANYKKVLAVPKRFVKEKDASYFVYLWNSSLKKTEEIKVAPKEIGENWRILFNLNENSILLDTPRNVIYQNIIPGKELKYDN